MVRPFFIFLLIPGIIFSAINLNYGTNVGNAIGFNLGNKMALVKNDFNIVYALDENEWNGHKSVQLLLKDIQ